MIGIFELNRLIHSQAYEKALAAARFLYSEGAQKVFLFGSIIRPETFCSHSDIDFAVEGLPEEKRFLIEARLIDLLYPFDFDLVLLDRHDIQVRKEISAAAKKDGMCIEKF